MTIANFRTDGPISGHLPRTDKPATTRVNKLVVDEDNPSWRDRAACLGVDPEAFFPIGNTGPALLMIEDAKAWCRRCDVVESCLQWALAAGADDGVFGGMSEDERRALKLQIRNARERDRKRGLRVGKQAQAAA